MSACDPYQSFTKRTKERTKLIENRRYLIWSGTYFLAVVVFGYSVVLLGFPVSEEVMRESALGLIATTLAGLIAISTTLSALAHMITHKNYGWLVPTLFLVFVSAYLYGFFVATRPNSRAN
jgi:hypothetical protein